MTVKYKTYKCNCCGYIISDLEVNRCLFDLLEFCPRCHEYRPFAVIKNEVKENADE